MYCLTTNLVISLERHLSPHFVLELLHLGDLGALPGVVQVDLVQLLVADLEILGEGVGVELLLLGVVTLGDGGQLGVGVEQVGGEDDGAAGDGTQHEVEVEVILELVIDPSGGTDGEGVVSSMTNLTNAMMLFMTIFNQINDDTNIPDWRPLPWGSEPFLES